MPQLSAFLINAMAGSQCGQSQSSPTFMIGWLVIMAAIFYFLMIRPQQRKEKERRSMMSALKTGDRILFGGGLIGMVGSVREHTLTVKIADNTRIEILRGAVTRVLPKDGDMEQAVKE